MGDTRVGVYVVNLSDAHGKAAGPVDCIVDTGATLSVLPKTVLDQARIVPHPETIALTLANGQTIHRRVGDAYLLLEGSPIPARVVFGEAGDPALVGVTVLEQGGFLVDPISRRLIPRKSFQLY